MNEEIYLVFIRSLCIFVDILPVCYINCLLYVHSFSLISNMSIIILWLSAVYLIISKAQRPCQTQVYKQLYLSVYVYTSLDSNEETNVYSSI